MEEYYATQANDIPESDVFAHFIQSPIIKAEMVEKVRILWANDAALRALELVCLCGAEWLEDHIVSDDKFDFRKCVRKIIKNSGEDRCTIRVINSMGIFWYDLDIKMYAYEGGIPYAYICMNDVSEPKNSNTLLFRELSILRLAAHATDMQVFTYDPYNDYLYFNTDNTDIEAFLRAYVPMRYGIEYREQLVDLMNTCLAFDKAYKTCINLGEATDVSTAEICCKAYFDNISSKKLIVGTLRNGKHG